MSESEREKWISDLRHFLSVSMPIIQSCKNNGKDFRQCFSEGLSIIESFPYCRSFVVETRDFCNFVSRVPALMRYVERVISDAEKICGKKIDLSDPLLLKRHVGRPTKQEAAARAFMEEKKRREDEMKETNLFKDEHSNCKENEAQYSTISGSISFNSMLHLDQLKWLLPIELQQAISSVRELRAQAAEKSTIAKEMALRGDSPSNVEPYAMEAAILTEKYEQIYKAVDEELAAIYVRLKEDRSLISEMELRKVNPSELRSLLRPYWDKLADKDSFKEKVIKSIIENDPEQAAERAYNDERKNKISRIIRYLGRKDKPNTKKRVTTMVERFNELIKLIGYDAALPYLLLVQDAIIDYAKNHKEK